MTFFPEKYFFPLWITYIPLKYVFLDLRLQTLKMVFLPQKNWLQNKYLTWIASIWKLEYISQVNSRNKCWGYIASWAWNLLNESLWSGSFFKKEKDCLPLISGWIEIKTFTLLGYTWNMTKRATGLKTGYSSWVILIDISQVLSFSISFPLFS